MAAAVLQTIKSFYLFSQIPESALSEFLRSAKTVSLPDGALVYDVGDKPDAVYIVLAGGVRLEVPLPDGEALFLGVAPVSTLFGEHEALCNTYSVARVSAMGDTRLCMVPKAGFLQLFEQQALFAQALARQLAMTMRMLCLAAAHHFNSNADKKLASLLVHLAEQVGEKLADNAGSEAGVSIRSSQDELAQMMSSTRQTVNKHLQIWRKAGWIGIQPGRVDIYQMDQIRALASTELLAALEANRLG